MANDEKQSRSRRTRASQEGADQVAEETQAETLPVGLETDTGQVDVPVGDAPAQSDPPPPPQPPPADDAPAQSDAYPKDVLVARAEMHLGVSPRLAAGLLRDAEDPITVDAAKARIQGFLDAPVGNHNEEA